MELTPTRSLFEGTSLVYFLPQEQSISQESFLRGKRNNSHPPDPWPCQSLKSGQISSHITSQLTIPSVKYHSVNLAGLVLCYQDVPGSQVSVDKGLLGEVLHSRGNLATEVQAHLRSI